jgi:hypothetical protein
VRCGALLLIAACACAADRDPAQTLARLRAIVLDQAKRIPNYACVQTIDRTVLRPAGKKPGSVGPCDQIAALKQKGKYRPTPASAQRFRVEVREGPGVEMYAWVGARRFSDRPLNELLGPGAITTGDMGPILTDAIEDAPELKFEGAQTASGRPAYAYSFDVPVDRSHHVFHTLGGADVATAYRGTILVDPETGTPLELSVLADELPPETNSCQFTAHLNYSPVAIGASSFLLPDKASQHLVTPGGVETEIAVGFSSCREYQAESTVSFGTEASPEPAAAPASARTPEPTAAPTAGAQNLDVPGGLDVAIAIDGPIDSDVAAAGDSFTGRLVKPLRDKSHIVYAPEGATVHGRVADVFFGLGASTVTALRLSVQSIEIGGREYVIHLTGDPGGAAAGGPSVAATKLRMREAIIIGELPPDGYLVVRSLSKRCVIHNGDRTYWLTVRQ